MNSVFKIAPYDNEKLEQYKTKAMGELNTFFNKKWVYNTPKIIVVDDRKTINLLKESETPDWVVGWSWERNAVFILNPDNFSTESSHIYSEEQVTKLIKHELCHSFFSTTFGLSNFGWINEGVSVYTADQFYMDKMPEKFDGFLDGKKVYVESGNAIKLLLDNFGKDRLFEFLKKQASIKEQTQLNSLFKEVFNADLSYEFFNNLKTKHAGGASTK